MYFMMKEDGMLGCIHTAYLRAELNPLGFVAGTHAFDENHGFRDFPVTGPYRHTAGRAVGRYHSFKFQ